MGNSIILEIVIILLLVVLNGLFAMSEIAIVSARKPRLQQWAEKGDKRAQLALSLAEDPEDFLSTVQIGITLIGIIAGVFGGATLAEDLAAVLANIGVPVQYSEPVGVGIVVAIITYLSLVIGELVPKNLALQNAERTAMAVATFMYRLSRIVYPFVWLLTVSTQFITRLLGVKPATDPSITDEEIEIMLQQGADVGVFDPEEPEIVRRIFRLSDRTVRSLMTPRREIVWIDRADDVDAIRKKIANQSFSRFPIAENDLDHVVGYIDVKDLIKQYSNDFDFDPFKIVYPPLFVPETMSALELLERFKEQHVHLALVFDEYGGLEGLVTSNDLLEAIVGNIDVPDTPLITPREDGSWLIDGTLPFEELLELLNLQDAERLRESHYQTVGGFTLSMVKGIPTEGQRFEWQGFRFEVMDMDGFRVDKVLVLAQGSLGRNNRA